LVLLKKEKAVSMDKQYHQWKEN